MSQSFRTPTIYWYFADRLQSVLVSKNDNDKYYINSCSRQLRKQHRIKIHLNLFLSFVFTNINMILWEHIVYYNRLETPDEVTYMRQDTVSVSLKE